MKAKLYEFNGMFGIELIPETMEEQTKLVRFGMKSTKQVFDKITNANDCGEIGTWITFGKNKRRSNTVK